MLTIKQPYEACYYCNVYLIPVAYIFSTGSVVSVPYTHEMLVT